jgi:hypothetical protein
MHQVTHRLAVNLSTVLHRQQLLILGNREADWCDENTNIVSELFADKVNKGNRDSTHLSKTE